MVADAKVPLARRGREQQHAAVLSARRASRAHGDAPGDGRFLLEADELDDAARAASAGEER